MLSPSHLQKWFPLQPAANVANAKATLLCFHSAASDPAIFTSPTVLRKRVGNKLVDFCKEHHVQLLCPHLPGRSFRHKDDLSKCTIPSLSDEIFQATMSLLSARPYIVAGHSMGAFLTFAFLSKVLEHNLPLPAFIILSSSVTPCEPLKNRNWNPVAPLTSDELRSRMPQWNMNEAALAPRMWPAFEPLIRYDIMMIDNYGPLKPLKLGNRNRPELILLVGDKDSNYTQETMKRWCDCFDPPYENVEVKKLNGSHALFYEEVARDQWFAVVISKLEQVLEIPKLVIDKPDSLSVTNPNPNLLPTSAERGSGTKALTVAFPAVASQQTTPDGAPEDEADEEELISGF